MCTDDNTASAPSRPPVQTFAATAKLLAAIDPGMHPRSGDFNGWAVVESVDTDVPAVVGVADCPNATSRTPGDTRIDIRGGPLRAHRPGAAHTRSTGSGDLTH